MPSEQLTSPLRQARGTRPSMVEWSSRRILAHPRPENRLDAANVLRDDRDREQTNLSRPRVNYLECTSFRAAVAPNFAGYDGWDASRSITRTQDPPGAAVHSPRRSTPSRRRAHSGRLPSGSETSPCWSNTAGSVATPPRQSATTRPPAET